MKKRFLSIAIAFPLILTFLITAVFAAGYTDTSGSEGEAAILRWTEAGVVSGDSGGFRPGSPMTRAEAAQVFVNLLKLTNSASLDAFADIDQDAWYADALSKCLSAGIFTGVSANSMEPNGPLTHEQFYVAVCRALGIAEAPSEETTWFSGSVAALVKLGVLDSSSAIPSSPVTRGEAMIFLDKLIPLYITTDGEYTAPSSGVTVIAGGSVSLTGGADGHVVVAGDGAKADLTGAPDISSVAVRGNEITVSGSPEEKPVNTARGLHGLTVNGKAVVTSITYQGKTVELSDKALYVDRSLTALELGSFAFNSLQDCAAAAKDGTKENATRIYLAPDVYWTDDYTKEEMRQSDDLIGLSIPQSYIYMIGLTGNRDDVVIASDRGQNAGANGNFNTLGISDGFHAKDITFGNYCNVDLVYERDPAQNHAKRQDAIVQAQVITKAPGVEAMDEWFFENCAFVSRLNVFSRSDLPDRTVYNDCHFECTDDSIGTGYISLYVNCDFDLYSNTPSGSASNYLQAYLGCTFNTRLANEGKINLSKHTRYFALIDCAFSGNMTGVEWRDTTLYDDMRNIVSNVTLNGEPLTVSPSNPEYTITPDSALLTAFKAGGEYNVYNLLNNAGFPEWDPLNQKSSMEEYAAPWQIMFKVDGEFTEENTAPDFVGDASTSYTVSPFILGGSSAEKVTWSVDRPDIVTLAPLSDGSVKVTALNYTYEDIHVCLTATASNGLAKVLHADIVSPELDAPEVLPDAGIKTVSGSVNVSYELTKPNVVVNGEKIEISSQLNPDNSIITWYRGEKADGSDGLAVATSTYVVPGSAPLTSYTLTKEDVGSYITAVIQPKYLHSQKGDALTLTTSKPIAEEDVAAESGSVNVDLAHLAYTLVPNGADEQDYEWDTSDLRDGFWYGGFYLPNEYREGGVFSNKRFKPAGGETPWTFANGTNGAAGTVGLQTTTQGARLVYVDGTPRGDMTLTVVMAPHKNAGQGFGSAYQYLEIYFKYDARTMTGYALRVTREGETDNELYKDYLSKSCSFQLLEYKNGVATPLTEKVYSTAFNPQSTVVLKMSGTELTCTVTTTQEQGSEYPDYMENSVELTATVAEPNTFGGIGFQHTGSSGEGKSGNRTTVNSIEIVYD